jgi:hypothetical protein
MKVLFFLALAAAIAWTALVVFANMMKPGETGGFLGGNTLVAAWVVVALFGLVAAVG